MLFTRQAIPDVTATLMRADSIIIQDSLMTMVLDGYALWTKRDMHRFGKRRRPFSSHFLAEPAGGVWFRAFGEQIDRNIACFRKK